METNREAIQTVMKQKCLRDWPEHRHIRSRKHFRFSYALAAGISVLLVGSCVMTGSSAVQVMSHMDSGFDYDETLGRLQYVSNILPESAMVFLSSEEEPMKIYIPIVDVEMTHVWSENEPWLEYSGAGDVNACMAGEVIAVIANRSGEYTLRLRHESGYESVYSGLNDVFVKEYETVSAGDTIGKADVSAGFELRKDGLSVLPTFITQK